MKTQKHKHPQKQGAGRPQEPAGAELTLGGFWRGYAAASTGRTRLVDLFMGYLGALVLLQVFYRLVVGDDFPRNAFVSGVFCPLGVIVLLAVLRGPRLHFRQLAEFFLAAIVLFVAAVNFAG